MPHKPFQSDRRALVGLLASAWVPNVFAEAAPSASAPAGAAMSAQLVKTGLYLIAGGGGNTLMRYSANGIILVDGKSPGQYRALRSQVGRIGRLADMPVRVLFITDLQPWHAGNAAAFLAARVAVIAPRRAAGVLAPEPAASAPAPVVGFDHEYRLRIGGVEVLALEVGSAATADSTVVHFPDLKVVALGDLVSAGAPQPDYATGGSLSGWGPALARVLALDFGTAVASTGGPIGRSEVEAFKAKLDTLVTRGRSLVREGVDRERFVARLDTTDLGWRFDVPSEHWDRCRADLAGER